jgi:hypothetical protein
MDDDQLLRAVRDSFSGVRLSVSEGETLRRGRALRARRRLVLGAVGVAALAGVSGGVAVTGIGPAATVPAAAGSAIPKPIGHAVAVAGSDGNGTTLDAWTVTAGPEGVVDVTVRQLADAAGLQRALRAAGVPARVAFQAGPLSDTPPLPAGCSSVTMPDRANAELQAKILSVPATGPAKGIALAIQTQAIPKDIGVYLAIQSGSGNHNWGWGMDLVQAAPACTG